MRGQDKNTRTEKTTCGSACVLTQRASLCLFSRAQLLLLQSVMTALVENGSQREVFLNEAIAMICFFFKKYFYFLSPHCINTRTRRKRPRDLRTRPHRARCTTAGAISRLSRSLRPSRCRRRVAESFRFFFLLVYLCERRV